MTKETILTVCAIVAGVVAVFELLEYIFTKNIPWLARLLRYSWRWLRRRFGQKQPQRQRYLVINFSAHPLMPAQQQAIQAKMGWPAVEIIETNLGNVPESRDFVAKTLQCLNNIDLLPQDWQTHPLVVVPAGYASAWSVLLAELHGRIGYFPDMVRLRPAPVGATEKYEVAEIVELRQIRNQARAKR